MYSHCIVPFNLHLTNMRSLGHLSVLLISKQNRPVVFAVFFKFYCFVPCWLKNSRMISYLKSVWYDDYLLNISMTGFSWCVTNIYGTIWLLRGFQQRISSAILAWTPATCYQMRSSSTSAHWDSMQRWYVLHLNFVKKKKIEKKRKKSL